MSLIEPAFSLSNRGGLLSDGPVCGPDASGVGLSVSCRCGLQHWIALRISAKRCLCAYYIFPTSFVFFGAGASVYHLSQSKFSVGDTRQFFFAIALACITLVLSLNLPILQDHLFFYILAVPFLFAMTKDSKIDRFIGELSYAVYLFHWGLLRVVQPQMHPAWGPTAMIGLSTLMAVVVHVGVEIPVNRLRSKYFGA